MAGYSLTTEMRAGGCSVQEVKAVGYSLKEMCAAGYSCSEAKAAGYSCSEAKAAGYMPFDCCVPCKSSGIPEKYPGSTSRSPYCYCNTTRAPVPTAARPACSSMRTAPCAAAASARERPRRCARHGLRCGRRGCANVHLQDRGGARHALVRPRSTDRKEAAQQADCCRHTVCYLTRCEFGEDEHDLGFTDTRWVAGARRAVRELRKSRLNSALKKHRKTEQEAADKAIVELEEGDDEA